MSIALLATILSIIVTVIDLYIYVIVAAVIASWLVAFGVVNPRNEFVRAVLSFLFGATDPVFRRIRRVIPAIGGLDLSPLVVLLILYAIEFFLGSAFRGVYFQPLL